MTIVRRSTVYIELIIYICVIFVHTIYYIIIHYTHTNVERDYYPFGGTLTRYYVIGFALSTIRGEGFGF